MRQGVAHGLIGVVVGEMFTGGQGIGFMIVYGGQSFATERIFLGVVIMAGENLAGTEVWLRIRDNGPGMSEEVRRRIFDPFYTTKSDGTGLGLALSKKVVESHGGSLEVQADSSSGTEFLLTFPQAHATRETST